LTKGAGKDTNIFNIKLRDYYSSLPFYYLYFRYPSNYMLETDQVPNEICYIKKIVANKMTVKYLWKLDVNEKPAGPQNIVSEIK
jgi:hypothetical protein